MASLTADGEIGGDTPDRALRVSLTATTLRSDALTARSLRANVAGTLAHHQATVEGAGNAADVDVEFVSRFEGGWSGNLSTGVWRGQIVALQSKGQYPLALAQPAELEAGAQGFHVAGLRGTLAGGRFAVDELRWQ